MKRKLKRSFLLVGVLLFPTTDMRVARNTDGERKFQRSEWLSKSQIQGFFSRLAASKRRTNKQEREDDEDHDDSLDEDEVAYLAEKERHMEVEEVVSKIGCTL